MSRLNGRLPQGIMGNPSERDNDFEPSCLVRTPSGNVYIPSDYKSNSSCSSPSKGDIQKNSERCGLPFGTPVPVLPVRNNLRRPNSSHFPQSRFQFRKGLASKCSWKCTAIIFIILSVVLCAALTYMSAVNLLNWSYQSAKACTVLVGENSEVFPPKSSAETNRSSSRNRPTTGGKYADPVDNISTKHPNRWRRDVDPVDNQHASIELDPIAQVGLEAVVAHVKSNLSISMHDKDLNTTNSEDLEEVQHAFVSAPLVISVSNTNFSILDNQQGLPRKRFELDEDLGSGFYPSRGDFSHAEAAFKELTEEHELDPDTNSVDLDSKVIDLGVPPVSEGNVEEDDRVRSGGPGWHGVVHGERVHSEQVHSEEVPVESAHGKHVHDEQVHSEEVPVEPVHGKHVHDEQGQSEPVHSEQAHSKHAPHSEDVHPAQVRSKHVHGEQVHNEEVHAQQGQGKHVHSEQGPHSEDVHPEQVHGEDTHGEEVHGNESDDGSTLLTPEHVHLNRDDDPISSADAGETVVHPVRETAQVLVNAKKDKDTVVSSADSEAPVHLQGNEDTLTDRADGSKSFEHLVSTTISVPLQEKETLPTGKTDHFGLAELEMNVSGDDHSQQKEKSPKERDGDLTPAEQEVNATANNLKNKQVLNMTVEAPENLKAKDGERSGISSAESIQHDDPVYSYGQDEVEIVRLNHESVTLKSNKGEMQHTSPDANKLNNEVDEHLLSRLDPTVTNSSHRSDGLHAVRTQLERNLEGVETAPELEAIPAKHVPVLTQSVSNIPMPANETLTASRDNATHPHVAKRVFVNVTIDTDDEPNSHKPVYVLSVSVPSSEDDTNKVEINPPSQKSAVVSLGEDRKKATKPDHFTTFSPYYIWGGVCECSCPCLDNSKETNDTDSVEEVEDSTSIIAGSPPATNQSTERLQQQKIEVIQVYSEPGGNVSSSSESPVVYIPTTTETEETPTTMTTSEPETTADETSPSEPSEDTIAGDLSSSTTSVSVEVSTATTTEAPSCPVVTPEPPLILILEGAKTFPARTFPPDGTTFSQISLGAKLSKDITPYSYWNMQFYQSEAAYVKFDYSIPRGASIGVYARRNALPTHTQYDILEVLSGFKARTTRGSHPTVKKEVTHFMEPGHWFLSLYNDDGDVQEVSFIAAVAEDMTSNCPNGCSGKGECLLGHCQCNAGFGGDDCGESVCPVLCSQRGEYINGECQCNPGWKGKECSLRHDECEVPDCNGHGHCVNGKCACVRGYMGKFCGEVDCPHPTCSSHGFCAEGVCICKKGWKGPDCSQMDNDALQCLPDCSGHGNFNLETQTCNCEPMWSGEDCSRELCDLDCGPHGHCVGEACMCNAGWSGEYCNLKQCDPRCNEHGQCKNGTCLCVTGWNGRHCTMEGCPNGCSGHGQCRVSNEGAWECRCYDAWDGRDCSTALEQSCSDGRDNDKDGLVDCEDPECCSNHLCRSSQLCVTAPKPIDILLRKQPPAITASFFERMKFLIEEGSLQNYAKQDTFNESRSAVVRGRVTTQMVMGLMGVRVSTATPLEGFTLTREDGWFDLLVNGGGTVTLQFGRSPFRPQTYIVNVPWNEVVIIDTVIMGMGDDRNLPLVPYSCAVHDYDLMKPVVLATWKHNFQGACPDKSAILAESQVVQESLQIPGTGLNLVYHSSRAAGYLSTIQLQLTPETIPASLKLIHLRITIEGILFEKMFEADPVIKFTYAWNRLNVYRQRVYGVTTAMVKVGYEYSDCRDVIWDVQTTKLSGHDMSISEVGGWNLDIHHRYNFHEGILQKGDGSNIYLKHKPRVILTTMGDGHQRPLDCFDCDGQASKQRLLAPVALATAPDGSIFVGDFNLVRRILVDGTVRTIVRLNATRVSYRYHLALSPLDGVLYISDPESHQIIRVRSVDDYSDPDHNWETAVGSGERCLPGDEAHCGDGALARDAKLAYPKGVAVSADNVVYFADGTNIRMVDRDGIVTTIIGNHMHKSHWKPIPCEGTLNVEEVHLRWPTELAINPLDNSLHIIDDHMILQLAPDGRVKVVAGRPLHCPSPVGGYDTELATHATLVMPQSIAFGPSGDLYVAESDSQRINRVRVIATDGKISHFAGAESKCNCLDRGCDCFEQDHYLASTSKFNTISSVSVTPDGILHIGDQANYRIRSVTASIPEASGAREYEIFSPDTQEIYVFNRFGQHIATKNILTGETSYLFTYNVNTSNGKLSTVTDTAGNKVFLLRDYSSQVNSIENTKGQKCRLRMSRMKLLQELTTPDNYNVTFDYHGPATGLLRTKLDSTGRSYVYNYDEFGRLTSAITPTGRVIGLSFDLSVKGATVKITQDNRKPVSMLIKGSSVVTKIGESEYRTVVALDGSVMSAAPWGHVISTDTVPYTVLGDRDPVLAESFPVPAKQKTEIGGDLANRFEWRYFLRRAGTKGPGGKGASNKAVVQVGRKLRVNGENLVTLEYDRETGTVAAFMDDRVELLNVTYDRTARPIKWGPRNGIFAGVDLEYDRFSRLIGWRWGELTETYGFDRAGRLSEIKYADGSSMIYAFKDMFSSLPLKVSTPRGSDYLLQYDEAGALQSLTTPRGHIHAFSLQTSLGFFKYQYFSPVSRHPYEILYNDDGQILAKVFPHQSGKVTYIYDDGGKLDTILDGLSSTSYIYQENAGLVKSVTIVEPNFELKQEFKHHAGILKDEKMKFAPKSGFDNAHFKYQYDGNARISGIDVEIAGKELPQLRLKYNQNLGMLEGISDLRIYRNTFNRSVMQDTSKQFFMITEYDSHGRVKSVLVNIKSFDVYRLELDYDNRNRIKMSKSLVGRATTSDKMTYNADGHVMEVTGDSNWKYVYDENGNVVGVIQRGEKITLGYDGGDRVVQYGDVELNSYDGRGFVVRRGEQKYRFDSRSKLIHAYEHDKFQTWYHYDERDRLIAWRDARGNVTQYFYANPTTPDLVTHLHFPKTSRTFRLLYDEKQLLVGVETSEQRFYVASDQNGSPVALFDTNGNIIKEIRRTPFGKVTKDSNPDFYLPVDFHGGLLDPNTGLVYLNKRLYDPQVGQWMTPDWEQLANHFTTPTDVFIYRFNNNDPINPSRNITYMTDLDSWLKLYGYGIDNMLGSAYTNNMVYRPSASITSPQLFPDLGATSGLQCIVDKVNAKFRAPGFVPEPLLKTEPTVRNLLPRIAYRRAVFGEALLISRVNDRALVSVVEGTNGVVQDVITSVLNNSFFLDLHFSLHDRDVFYFVKENVLKMRDDREELKRLGSMFNVTMAHEEGGGGGGELRLHSPDAAVLVRYGVDPELERHRLLKHAHKRAVERAWQIEKVLVAAGLRGRADWTPEEREELLLHGSVAGYEGVDVHGIHKYPLIADDPGNVAFRRDNKRKRRAQRTQRHKAS